ncbi:MAG: alpha/beta hydrolase [Verrucomicrobia bacterium]|nr:alpha/beta hydrolase [Verrucomicrobiota bacterium]
MKHLPLVFLFALATSAADLPAPHAVEPFPQNLSRNGPPIPATPPVESAHPASVLLWSAGAPGSEDRKHEAEHISWRQEPDIVFPVISNIHAPSLTPFLPAPAKAAGCAVIIAPGGGHMQLTIDREGYDLARWLAARGVAGFVLKHRLARDTSTPRGTAQPYSIEQHAQADAARAIRLVRTRAAEWQVKTDRVGIMGFSAGGELAILAALRHTPGNPDAADLVERASSRPDFFAPIYPGGLQRDDVRVREGITPPAFLACAADDRMPVQLAAFFTTLRKAGVNAELHIYSTGGHGFGVRPDRPDLAVSSWQARFYDWLGDRGFLK